MFQALRIRDFRLLWTGGIISALGSWLLVLAVPAHIFLTSRSYAATGLTMAAEYAPQLILGPVAGAVADRWDRRRLMICADLFRAAVVAAMLLAVAPGHYWLFYPALAAETTASILFGPAGTALGVAIVGTGTALSSANSLGTLSNGIVRLLGGPLGGILFAFAGIKVLIYADALSYLASAAFITMTSRNDAPPSPRAQPRPSIWQDLRTGLSILRDQPAARALLPVTVIFLTANACLSAVIIPLGVQHLGGSRQTGILFGALGIGFLAAAPVLGVLLDRAQPRYLLTATLCATAVSYWLLFHAASLATALPAAVAIGMTGSMCLVIPQTTVQRLIPDAALGRISAVFGTGEAAATLTGALTGPILAQAIGLGGIATAASVTTVVAAVLTVTLLSAVPLPGKQVPEPAP